MGQLLNITDDLKGVDPRMVDIVKRAAAASPYDVKITDAMRAGGKGNHKHGYAIDVALIDPRTGAELPNKMYYKNGTIIPGAVDAFPVYERFAQTARARRRIPGIEHVPLGRRLPAGRHAIRHDALGHHAQSCRWDGLL